MITADSSTWIALWQERPGADSTRLREALREHSVVIAPPVLAELYSAARLPPKLARDLGALTLLAIFPGYWQRAGELRARVLGRGRKARLGDALIAQCCIDHDVPLLTRDHDFRAFADSAELALLLD